MRVGVDARLLTTASTGDRTYWLGLLKAILQQNSSIELVLFTCRPFPRGILPPVSSWQEVCVPARNERWWSLVHLPRAARRARVELVHVQYTVSPFFRQPVVTTVHDIAFLIEPRWFPLKDRLLLRWSVPASCRRAARVITVSETSRQDILRYLHLPPNKVVAIPNGLSEGFAPLSKREAQAWVRTHYGIDPPYLLAVGVLQPRKNWGLALQAVASARERSGLLLRLLLVGKPGWAQAELTTLIAQLGAQEWVRLTGYVPDEHLPFLYNASEALLYPSLYEGFGLPPLEAMGCGTPVIVSNRGALPEVVAEGGIVLPPDEPGWWTEAILTILQNETYRQQLREKALKRAAHFSWQEAARRTIEIYRQVALRV